MKNINFSDLKEGKKEIGNTHINIGVGKDIYIKELAEKVQEIVGFKGEINWDTTKPDGTPQKLLDVSKLNELGWKEKIELKDGIEKTYTNFNIN
jgi:GDP-L-fucose synthase